MKQRSLRILCVYHDAEPRYLDAPPEVALEGYDVTCIHSYVEARDAIMDPRNGTPPFDVILTDTYIPRTSKPGSETSIAFLLQPIASAALVRGFGVFIPEFITERVEMSCEFEAYVASDPFRLPDESRDWRGLLDAVMAALERGPSIRYPDH